MITPPNGRTYTPSPEELEQEEQDRRRTYMLDEVEGNRWARQEREREESEREEET